jgi:hypothetical protein
MTFLKYTGPVLSPNLRTPNPGFKLGFTSPFYITNARGEPRVKPEFGVLGPHLRTPKLRVITG